MVESRYVLHGLIAGTVSGLVTGVFVFLTMPSVEEVLETIKQYMGNQTLGEELLAKYVSIMLWLSPFITFIFSLILGALFGALYEYIDKKMEKNILVPALITGAILWIILVIPNMVLGASSIKIIINNISALTYTITLSILAIMKNPRANQEQVLGNG